jgi:hypothetical protein
VIINGWLDWCDHLPGPTDKVYSAKNAGNGLALHSMEGYGYGGIHGRMNNTDRDAGGRYTFYAQASWMFSLMVDGTLIQHYPVTASTWTSGNWLANTTLWGIESEGKAGFPLTAAQVKTFIRLAREYEAHTGKPATREHPIRTLWEHNEVAQWAEPNGGPTSCPSRRYDPAYAELARPTTTETDMTPEERATFNALVGIFGGAEKIKAAAAGGMDYLLGYAIEQAEQNQLEAVVARLEAAGQGSVLRALRDELNALPT